MALYKSNHQQIERLELQASGRRSYCHWQALAGAECATAA